MKGVPATLNASGGMAQQEVSLMDEQNATATVDAVRCESCHAPATHRNVHGDPACERCARRDHAHRAGETYTGLAILAVTLEALRSAGMTDEEIVAAVHLNLRDHVDVPDAVGMAPHMCWFEHRTPLGVVSPA
jgi:hypothetical protein